MQDSLSVDACQVSESGSSHEQSTSSVTPKLTEVVYNCTEFATQSENTVKDQAAEQGNQSPPKKRTRYIDTEWIIMGEELSDLEINFAQQSY